LDNGDSEVRSTPDFGAPWMRTDLQFREKKAVWGINMSNMSADVFDVVVAGARVDWIMAIVRYVV
jgi:hypothetical protein